MSNFYSRPGKAGGLPFLFISGAIAFIIGCITNAGLIQNNLDHKTSWAIAIGFLSGYFADKAVGKMSEVADAIFGQHTPKH